jgi:hypothetical protein
LFPSACALCRRAVETQNAPLKLGGRLAVGLRVISIRDNPELLRSHSGVKDAPRVAARHRPIGFTADQQNWECAHSDSGFRRNFLRSEFAVAFNRAKREKHSGTKQRLSQPRAPMQTSIVIRHFPEIAEWRLRHNAVNSRVDASGLQGDRCSH